MWEFVRSQNYAFSIDDVKDTSSNCRTCREVKPSFFKPSQKSSVIRALHPFERLAIDLVGPKTPASGPGKITALTLIDEYSRFPFAFGLKNITSSAIIKLLQSLLAVFGCPGYIQNDRGSQFLSEEFDQFCLDNGIAYFRSTPYNPRGNGHSEWFNGSIFKIVRCILHPRT